MDAATNSRSYLRLIPLASESYDAFAELKNKISQNLSLDEYSLSHFSLAGKSVLQKIENKIFDTTTWAAKKAQDFMLSESPELWHQSATKLLGGHTAAVQNILEAGIQIALSNTSAERILENNAKPSVAESEISLPSSPVSVSLPVTHEAHSLLPSKNSESPFLSLDAQQVLPTLVQVDLQPELVNGDLTNELKTQTAPEPTTHAVDVQESAATVRSGNAETATLDLLNRSALPEVGLESYAVRFDFNDFAGKGILLLDHSINTFMQDGLFATHFSNAGAKGEAILPAQNEKTKGTGVAAPVRATTYAVASSLTLPGVTTIKEVLKLVFDDATLPHQQTVFSVKMISETESTCSLRDQNPAKDVSRFINAAAFTKTKLNAIDVSDAERDAETVLVAKELSERFEKVSDFEATSSGQGLH